MSDSSGAQTLPSSVERVLKYFRSLGREEKMQALVAYSKRLEPVPDRFKALPREAFSVPECMTPVDLFPEERDGRRVEQALPGLRPDRVAEERVVVAALQAVGAGVLLVRPYGLFGRATAV